MMDSAWATKATKLLLMFPAAVRMQVFSDFAANQSLVSGKMPGLAKLLSGQKVSKQAVTLALSSWQPNTSASTPSSSSSLRQSDARIGGGAGESAGDNTGANTGNDSGSSSTQNGRASLRRRASSKATTTSSTTPASDLSSNQRVGKGKRSTNQSAQKRRVSQREEDAEHEGCVKAGEEKGDVQEVLGETAGRKAKRASTNTNRKSKSTSKSNSESGGSVIGGAEATNHKQALESTNGVALLSTATDNNQQSERLYCVCRQPYDASLPMVACDGCDEWFHCACVGLTREQALSMDDYYCESCRARQHVGKKQDTANARDAVTPSRTRVP